MGGGLTRHRRRSKRTGPLPAPGASSHGIGPHDDSGEPEDGRPGGHGGKDGGAAAAARHRRTFYLVGAADWALDFHVLIVAALLVVERTGSGAALFAVAASNWLAETVFEIPTGYIADRYGRTLSTAASFALRGVGFLVVAASHTPLQFVVGWVIVGLGSTMLSGALEAWAVDHEREAGGSVDALLLRAQRAQSLAMLVAIGGAVAVGGISYAAPFVVAGITGLVLAPVVAIAMGPDAGVAGRAAARSTGLRIIPTVLSHRDYRPLFLLGAGMTFAIAIPGVQWAPAVEEVYPTLALVPLGAVRAVAPALRAGTNWFVERAVTRFGRRLTFLTLLLVSAALLGTVARIGGLGLIIGFAFYSALSGIATVLIGARLNEVITTPEWRATILSLYSATLGLVTGIGLLVVGAAVGEPGDRHGVWLVSAGVLAALGVVAGLRPRVLDGPEAAAPARVPTAG